MIEEFKANLKALYRQYSFYVVALFSGAGAYWLQLPLQEQAALLEMVPVIKYLAPATGFIVFMIARGLPQRPRESKGD